MLRLLQHALVLSAVLYHCRDWLFVLFFYARAEAACGTQITTGTTYARQKELVQAKAVRRLVPWLAAFVVYWSWWHLHDAHYHRNEVLRDTARMQPPPRGCFIADHHLDEPWAWPHLRGMIDQIAGTHLVENACADYNHRISLTLEPSWLEVSVELACLPFVTAADQMGKAVALFLEHQRIFVLALVGLLMPAVIALGLYFAAPYMVTAGTQLMAAGAYAKTHAPFRKRRDELRRQRALEAIHRDEDDDWKRRANRMLQQEDRQMFLLEYNPTPLPQQRVEEL